MLAGKIVSVETLHAAAIRDLINNGSFADPDEVSAQGLVVVRKPPEVLAFTDKNIVNKIVAIHFQKYTAALTTVGPAMKSLANIVHKLALDTASLFMTSLMKMACGQQTHLCYFYP